MNNNKKKKRNKNSKTQENSAATTKQPNVTKLKMWELGGERVEWEVFYHEAPNPSLSPLPWKSNSKSSLNPTKFGENELSDVLMERSGKSCKGRNK